MAVHPYKSEQSVPFKIPNVLGSPHFPFSLSCLQLSFVKGHEKISGIEPDFDSFCKMAFLGSCFCFCWEGGLRVNIKAKA